MFDVFNGTSATAADVLDAMNTVISIQATYNVVAINMSLGDGSSHSTQSDVLDDASWRSTLQQPH